MHIGSTAKKSSFFLNFANSSATVHIHEIAIQSRHSNNKMERFNGEVRDREKVMRGLKQETSPILKGYQIFHNYIRPHEALEGKNKWVTLIQNASQSLSQLSILLKPFSLKFSSNKPLSE